MDESRALALARQSLQQQAETLLGLAGQLDSRFWTTARLIADCPGIVWVTGVGTSAAMGMRFAHILTDCGVRSIFLSPDMGLHGHSGAMKPGEVLLALSRGGESREVNQMAEVAQRLGLTAVALVNDLDSTLARSCSLTLPVRSPAEFELGGYAATTSTMAMAGICDALSAVVLKLTGYSMEAFRHTHPGGAVGQSMDSDASGRDPTD